MSYIRPLPVVSVPQTVEGDGGGGGRAARSAQEEDARPEGLLRGHEPAFARKHPTGDDEAPVDPRHSPPGAGFPVVWMSVASRSAPQSRPPDATAAESGRGGTPPLPHHEACRLLALRGFRSLAPFVQRVLGFSSRRIRFGTLRPYLGTPLRRLLSPSFHGLPLCFSCPSSVRSKSLNVLRIQPFATLRQLLWPLLTSPRPSPVIADELVLSPRRRDLLE